MKNRDEKLWLEIQHRSIAIIGKPIGDLVRKEVGRLLDALSRRERIGFVHQLLRVYLYRNIAIRSEEWPAVVTQEHLQATATSEDAQSEVYRALAAGARVAPGPLTAYLRRGSGQGFSRDFQLVVRVRRARQGTV